MKESLSEILNYPFDNDFILRKQKSIKRKLLERTGAEYLPVRIAILGGSTTADIKNLLEIFLLNVGIKAEFYESEYNKFYEDAVFDNPALEEFKPTIIIIFTSVVNLLNRPEVADDEKSAQEKLQREYERYELIWKNLAEKYPESTVIQNNMDIPYENFLGNLAAVLPQGLNRFLDNLNEKFAQYAATHSNFYIHDLHGLSARTGLNNWHNRAQYYAYKFAMNYDVIPDVSRSLANIIQAILGKSKKCLVLDLDNTLWGGVIGDDGINGIIIGHETPQAEAFTAFQEYVKRLKERGIILAVCSKNDEDIAKSGFNHPDSVLKFEDFAAFKANWQPKNINIQEIAREINIGIDSLVFIDDNPVERQIVRENLPEVAVPEVDPANIYSYISAIEKSGYFEPVTISQDDLQRNKTYQENKQRRNLEESAVSYDDFLKSLEMTAEIAPFKEIYFDRIAQLTNKTNQFNLTTKRFTLAEISQIAANENYLTLYGRLKDKFGDNGLVSVIIGEIAGDELKIILWLMSCRVLKRGVENIMMNALIKIAAENNLCSVTGFYFETKKNSMVKDFYKNFGFKQISQNNNDTVWNLKISDYVPQENFIEVNIEKPNEGGGKTASNQHFLRI